MQSSHPEDARAALQLALECDPSNDERASIERTLARLDRVK
jgi:hypothetical protein